jgi:hypothetical protein
MSACPNFNFDFDEFARCWKKGPVVTRAQTSLDEFSGGLLNANTLAKEDSLGTGPDEVIRIGKKVAYTPESLVRYLKRKAKASATITPPPPRKRRNGAVS